MILVAGKRLSGDQMREVQACGCDELLIAPMTADELHDVIAIQLGEPRPGTEAFQISISLGGRKVDATVSNLSIDGVRAVVHEPVSEGQAVDVTVTPDGEGPISIKGTAVWAQPRDSKTVIGVAFSTLDDAARGVLAKLTQWQVVKDGSARASSCAATSPKPRASTSYYPRWSAASCSTWRRSRT